MKKKLYSISELINENIKLKKQTEKTNINHLKNIINLLELIDKSEIDIKKCLNGFKEELKSLI